MSAKALVLSPRRRRQAALSAQAFPTPRYKIRFTLERGGVSCTQTQDQVQVREGVVSCTQIQDQVQVRGGGVSCTQIQNQVQVRGGGGFMHPDTKSGSG